MDSFNLEKITELEIDIFNQYLYMFDFIVKYDEWLMYSKVELIFDVKKLDENSEKHLAIIDRIYKLILNDYFPSEVEKISTQEVLKHFKDLKMVFPKGCPKVKKNLVKSYICDDYHEIYNEMLENKNNKKYKELMEIHRCSIQSLIDVLDKLHLLKNKLSCIDLKIANFEYKKIFKEYALMNHADYGIDNPELKTKIDKVRSQKGNYQQLISKKNKIFLEVLLEQCEVQGKWENPSQAVKSNIKRINNKFKEFDTEWIHDEIIKNTDQINILEGLIQGSKNGIKRREKYCKELNELKLRNEKLNSNLADGYPFHNLEKILPYNTPDFEEILIKRLRKEISVLDEIITKC